MMLKTILYRAKTRTRRIGVTSVAVGALASAASMGAVACPSINAYDNFANSTIVGAAVDESPGTATYYFTSMEERYPSNGVPGLIEYCVYPDGGIPDGLNPVALVLGANDDPWTTTTGPHQGYFSFVRPDGNPSNLPLSLSTLDVKIGTATPSGRAKLLMHINDVTECSALYNRRNLSTCWVKPEPIEPPDGGPPPPPA